MEMLPFLSLSSVPLCLCVNDCARNCLFRFSIPGDQCQFTAEAQREQRSAESNLSRGGISYTSALSLRPLRLDGEGALSHSDSGFQTKDIPFFR
jgi:hypothetical protein